MAKTSVLTIMIQLAKKGDADRSTIKGLAELKNNIGLAVGAFTAFTGAAIGVGIAVNKAAQVFTDYAAQVRDLARLTGMTTEETSKLIQAADDVTISYESLQKALWFAAKNGIEVNIESLSNLADEYNALGSAAEKAEFLAKNFGKSGDEMGKLMEKGGAGVRQMTNDISGSLVVTEAAAASARLYEIQLDNLNDQVEALKMSFGAGLVGLLTGSTVEIQKQAQALFVAANGYEYNTNMAGRYTEAQHAAWEESVRMATEQWMVENGLKAATEATKDATLSNEELAASAEAVSAKNQDLVSLMMNLQEETTDYNQKNDELKAKLSELYAEQTKYIEGGRRYKEIQGEIDETSASVQELAAAHEDAGKRIAFSLLQQKLAVDGLTDAEFTNLLSIGNQWGIIDKKTAESAMIMDAQATAMANSFAKPDSQMMDLIAKIQTMGKLSGSSFDFYVNINTSGSIPKFTPQQIAGGSCFTGDTLVRMADGSERRIDTIQAGDAVLSYDLTTHRHVQATVVETFAHEPQDVGQLLKINGLKVTAEHLIWIHGKWKPAGELWLGATLLKVEGDIEVITSIEPIDAEPVYNIHTDHPSHNYFADGVLVHNAKNMASGGVPDPNQMTIVGEGASGWSPTAEVLYNGTVIPHGAAQWMKDAGMLNGAQQAMYGSVEDLQETRAVAAGNVARRRARRRNRARTASPVHGATASAQESGDTAVVETVSAATEVSAAAVQSSVAAQQQATKEAIDTRKTIEAGNSTIAGKLDELNNNLQYYNATLQRSIVAAVQKANF